MPDGDAVMPSEVPVHGAHAGAVSGSPPVWPALFEERVRAVTVVVVRKRPQMAEPETSSQLAADAGGEVERKTRVFVVPTEPRAAITDPAHKGLAVAPAAVACGTRRRQSALHRPGKVVLIVPPQDNVHPPADVGLDETALNDTTPVCRPQVDDWLPPPLASDYPTVQASLAHVLTLGKQAQAASRWRFRR